MSKIPPEIRELLEEHQVNIDDFGGDGISEEIIEKVISDLEELDEESETTIQMLRILCDFD